MVNDLKNTPSHHEVKKTIKTEKVDIPIIGMSCASCAATIQKGLNKLGGVGTQAGQTRTNYQLREKIRLRC